MPTKKNIIAPENFVLKAGTKTDLGTETTTQNQSSNLDNTFKINPNAKRPKYNSDWDFFRKELNSNHIYEESQIDRFNKFSRFGFFDPYNTNSVTREYLFFTKMDLHLFANDNISLNPELMNIPFFNNCFNSYKNTMYQLQWSARHETNNSPFCNLLTNSVSSSLDLQDISIDKLETAANIKGTKLEYPLPTVTPSNLQEFNLEFNDTKFLDVYMFFRIWYEYELLKINGQVTPPDVFYIHNKILHDQMSLYRIVVGEDMETIIHWSKFWGVYPTVIPRSVMNDVEGPIKFSASFSSQFVEDMDPTILADFNLIVQDLVAGKEDIPIYDTSISMVNGEWCYMPYIKADRLKGRQVYKLKWR